MTSDEQLSWIDDLLARYKEALRQLGRTEAQIGLATIPHRQAIAKLRAAQEIADEVVAD